MNIDHNKEVLNKTTKAQKYDVVSGSQIQVSDEGEKILITPVENEFISNELVAECEGESPQQKLLKDSVGREEL